MNPLHHGPHDDQTTCFRRKRVDLISVLAHITEKAFDGVRRADIPMHHGRKGIKGQQMLFVFHQTPHGLRIAHVIFALEGRYLYQSLRFPDSGQLSGHCAHAWEWHS